jgi:hypothetical protein
MHDLFNPAGLGMLEDQRGAIAYGYVAPRVFYARFVGQLSATLAANYVERLEAAVGQLPALAYFADASALREYDLVARTHFARFVANCRVKLASFVVLSWAGGIGPAARAFSASRGEPVRILTCPLEFERALANVAPTAARLVIELPQVWQVHAQLAEAGATQNRAREDRLGGRGGEQIGARGLP